MTRQTTSVPPARLPYRVERLEDRRVGFHVLSIVDADRFAIANLIPNSFIDGQHRATAAFIVRACNAYIGCSPDTSSDVSDEDVRDARRVMRLEA